MHDIASLENIWPLIRAELPNAIQRAQALVQRPPDDVISSLHTRYAMGESLYKRDFLTWGRERFTEEVMCELADMFLYLAMEKVVHPDTGDN
jgi:hypothetical protein